MTRSRMEPSIHETDQGAFDYRSKPRQLFSNVDEREIGHPFGGRMTATPERMDSGITGRNEPNPYNSSMDYDESIISPTDSSVSRRDSESQSWSRQSSSRGTVPSSVQSVEYQQDVYSQRRGRHAQSYDQTGYGSTSSRRSPPRTRFEDLRAMPPPSTADQPFIRYEQSRIQAAHRPASPHQYPPGSGYMHTRDGFPLATSEVTDSRAGLTRPTQEDLSHRESSLPYRQVTYGEDPRKDSSARTIVRGRELIDPGRRDSESPPGGKKPMMEDDSPLPSGKKFLVHPSRKERAPRSDSPPSGDRNISMRQSSRRDRTTSPGGDYERISGTRRHPREEYQ